MSFFRFTRSGENFFVNLILNELLAGQAISDNGSSFAEQST